MIKGGNRDVAKLLMERSVPGRVGAILPDSDVPPQPLHDASLLRKDLELPEISEPEVVQYFTALSQLNFSIDTHFYPLGSCTMKYNPKVNDEVSFLPGFAGIHPLQPPDQSQGALELLHRLQGFLAEITGLPGVSLATSSRAKPRVPPTSHSNTTTLPINRIRRMTCTPFSPPLSGKKHPT